MNSPFYEMDRATTRRRVIKRGLIAAIASLATIGVSSQIANEDTTPIIEPHLIPEKGVGTPFPNIQLDPIGEAMLERNRRTKEYDALKRAQGSCADTEIPATISSSGSANEQNAPSIEAFEVLLGDCALKHAMIGHPMLAEQFSSAIENEELRSEVETAVDLQQAARVTIDLITPHPSPISEKELALIDDTTSRATIDLLIANREQALPAAERLLSEAEQSWSAINDRAEDVMQDLYAQTDYASTITI